MKLLREYLVLNINPPTYIELLNITKISIAKDNISVCSTEAGSNNNVYSEKMFL